MNAQAIKNGAKTLLGIDSDDRSAEEQWKSHWAIAVSDEVFGESSFDFYVDNHDISQRIRTAIEGFEATIQTDYAGMIEAGAVQPLPHEEVITEHATARTQAIDDMVDFLYDVKTDLEQRHERREAGEKYGTFYATMASLMRCLQNNVVDADLFEEVGKGYAHDKDALKNKIDSLKAKVENIDSTISEFDLAKYADECPSLTLETPFGPYKILKEIPAEVREKLKADWKGSDEGFNQSYSGMIELLKDKVNTIVEMGKTLDEYQPAYELFPLIVNAKAHEYVESAKAMAGVVGYFKANYNPDASPEQSWSFEDTVETMSEALGALTRHMSDDHTPEQRYELTPEALARFEILEDEFGKAFKYQLPELN